MEPGDEGGNRPDGNRSDGNQPDGNQSDRGLQRVMVAVGGAVIVFCLVAAATYYKMNGVSANGWMYRGPASMTAAGGGLFVGGFAAFVALILLLQRR